MNNSNSSAGLDKRRDSGWFVYRRSRPANVSRAKLAPSNGRPVHLLENWARPLARLRGAKLIALFMDFDGTLATLQSRPATSPTEPQHAWSPQPARAAPPRFAGG